MRERLREIYGVPTMEPHGDPLAELVLTVLSQSTNDRNRDVAFLRLRERFPSWEAVRAAPVAEIEAAIQPGGLHVQKSRRIKEILEALPEDLDLSWMREAPVARVARGALRAPGRRAQDRRVRAAVRLRAARRARSTPTSAASARGSGCCARARRSTSCTTRCCG